MTVAQRIPHLDGIRGLAILLILARHFSDGSALETLFYLGWTGVDLFFVLSGFLITGILLDTREQKGYYRVFITRRILRIFPLYYGVLLICLLASPHLSILSWFRDYQLYFWTYTQNYLIAEKGFFTLPLGHFWSLAIEEQFYLLWPLVVYLCGKKRLLPVIAVLIATAILVRYFSNNPVFTAVATPARMDSLLIGSAIAVIMRTDKTMLQRASPYLLLLSFVALAGFIIWEKAWTGRSLASNYWGYTLIACFYGSLLAWSFCNQSLQKALSFRPLRELGKYAYGIYVYHAILINLARYYYPEYVANQQPVTFILLLLLTLVVSVISYHLIEKRFLALKPGFSTSVN